MQNIALWQYIVIAGPSFLLGILAAVWFIRYEEET